MLYRRGIFAKPVQVIQVFRKVHFFGKENRSFDSRKEHVQWSDIPSINGHVDAHGLWLPPYLIEEHNFSQAKMIFLIDEHLISPFKMDVQRSIAFPFSKKYKLYCFSFDEMLKIRFHYEHFEIGIPSREDFDVGQLKKSKLLEIKINGKYDATMSRGRERLFKEQHFIFEYLGEFAEYWHMKEPLQPFMKFVNEDRKVINLLKPLW